MSFNAKRGQLCFPRDCLLPSGVRRATLIPMKRAYFLVLSFLLLAVGGCRVHDVRTVEIRAPGVRCEQCSERVAQALGMLEGVKAEKLGFDLEQGIVTVTYDSMQVAIKNMEYAVAGAGYDVETKPYPLPADAAARDALPPECREHIR